MVQTGELANRRSVIPPAAGLTYGQKPHHKAVLTRVRLLGNAQWMLSAAAESGFWITCEKDSLAEEIRGGVTELLSMEHLGPVVVAFGGTRAVGQAEPGGDGIEILAEAGDEAVRGVDDCVLFAHPVRQVARVSSFP